LKKELITSKAVQHPGSAKASTFQVFTNSKASSLDELRRQINYFNNMYLNHVQKNVADTKIPPNGRKITDTNNSQITRHF